MADAWQPGDVRDLLKTLRGIERNGEPLHRDRVAFALFKQRLAAEGLMLEAGTVTLIAQAAFDAADLFLAVQASRKPKR